MDNAEYRPASVNGGFSTAFKVGEHPAQHEVEEAKKIYTKENPHPTGAYFDPELGKWKGYKPTKGMRPPWNPFRPGGKRQDRVTMNERKFLLLLSVTGSLTEAFKGVYKVTPMQNKKLENARIRFKAHALLERLKQKVPEFVEQVTYADITPDFVRGELMKLYKHDHATIAEKIRITELMGKLHGMFTEKTVVQERVREIKETIYQESDEDFNTQEDHRVSRVDINEKILEKTQNADSKSE